MGGIGAVQQELALARPFKRVQAIRDNGNVEGIGVDEIKGRGRPGLQRLPELRVIGGAVDQEQGFEFVLVVMGNPAQGRAWPVGVLPLLKGFS